MKNVNAQALGSLGGKAKAKKYPHSHYVEIGKKGSDIKYKKYDLLGTTLEVETYIPIK